MRGQLCNHYRYEGSTITRALAPRDRISRPLCSKSSKSTRVSLAPSAAYSHSSGGLTWDVYTSLFIVHEHLWINCRVAFSTRFATVHVWDAVEQRPLLNHYGNPNFATVLVMKSFSPAGNRSFSCYSRTKKKRNQITATATPGQRSNNGVSDTEENAHGKLASADSQSCVKSNTRPAGVDCHLLVPVKILTERSNAQIL